MIVCCRDGRGSSIGWIDAIDGEHVADLDAVGRALVERDDAAAAGLEAAERHAQDARVDRLVRRMRHVVDERLARRRQHAVADQDFLGSPIRCARWRGRRISRRARCRGTCSRSPGLRCRRGDDRARGPVDVPVVAGLLVDAQHVDDVAACRGPDALALRPRRISAALSRPSGPVTSGASGTARCRSAECSGSRRRRATSRASSATTRPCRARQRELRLAVDEVEPDDVARIDEVRILDLLAVHPPDVGPAPRFLQELAGDAPERVALLHRVARRGAVGDLEVCGVCAPATLPRPAARAATAAAGETLW